MRLKSTGLPQIPQMVCVLSIFCLAFSYAPLFPGCLSVLVSMILLCGSSTGSKVKDYKSPCCLLSFLYQLKERRQNKKTEDPELSFCLNVFGVCFELSLNCILPHRSYCLQLSATVNLCLLCHPLHLPPPMLNTVSAPTVFPLLQVVSVTVSFLAFPCVYDLTLFLSLCVLTIATVAIPVYNNV